MESAMSLPRDLDPAPADPLRKGDQGLRVVIVEDDGLIALDLAELLIGMGHDVCAIAGTEAAAEAAAAQHRPDLMIVDGALRGGSGVAAMRRILGKGDIAHFYITGNHWAVREQAPGAIVVTKPFTLRDLERSIASAGDAMRARFNPV
jgi:CheY-like chemotaxis protein